MKDSACPICSLPIDFNPRYPNAVCNSCDAKATDKAGRKLGFANTSIGGGYQAFYTDNNEDYDSHVCYIDGIECNADEARFGGIVIQKATNY